MIEGEDGVTHINVYSKAETPTGRWLSNFAYSPIETADGEFDSIEGYWYWLLTHDEKLRGLSGYEAKSYGKEAVENLHDSIRHTRQEEPEFEQFRDQIRKAIDIKLKSYRDQSRLMCQLKPPLCHYYVYGDKRVNAHHEWIIEHIEMRRGMLREHWKL